MTKKINFEVINILKLIRNNLLFLIIVVVIGGGGTFLYNHFLTEPVYEVKTTFLLRSSQSLLSATTDNAATAANAELSNITIFQKQMQTYLELAQQSDLKDQTDKELSLTKDQKEAITSVTTSNTTDSQLIVVTVRGTDYDLIKTYVSEFSKNFKSFSADNFGTDNLRIVSDAKGKETPVAPSKLRNTVIGALAALFIGTNIIIIRYIRRDLIESHEEIESILDVPIVGAIPFSDEEAKTKTTGKNYVY